MKTHINLNMNQSTLFRFFKGQPTLEDYLKLDESIVLYYFQVWQEEDDPILKDLCRRFVKSPLI